MKFFKRCGISIFAFGEVGGHPDTAPCPPPAVPVPTASILNVSNSVAPNMDELTNNVSEWGGVSVPTIHQSQHSHDGSSGSRIEWTWRTATESNMPNSLKSLNSVQEEFCEVSEPNPMGNAVASEETQCCWRSSHSFCSYSASCGHCILSKYPHQQASLHQA